MQEKRYLLSIEELLEKAEVLSREEWNTYVTMLCEKLDEERCRKVQSIKMPRKQAESLGAGLLLQYALQECQRDIRNSEVTLCRQQEIHLKRRVQSAGEQIITILSLQQLLEKVVRPISLTYTYGPQGKPYLQDYPLYFNLSHSGEYIFCAVSEQEIGADIQIMDGKISEQIVQRFFSEEERKAWEECNVEGRRDLFYRLWCRKEAYGKLTGQGVAAALGMNFVRKFEDDQVIINSDGDGTQEESPSQQFEWEEYNLADEYKIVVCKWK